MSQDEVTAGPPQIRKIPHGIIERLAAYNFDPRRLGALIAGLTHAVHSYDVEYDQGDVVAVYYDDIIDLIWCAQALLEDATALHVHTDGGRHTTEHEHAYGYIQHSHAMRAVCSIPECEGYPTHNIHPGP